MDRKKIELQIVSISSSQTEVGAYVLLLNEIDGVRQLSINIGASEAQVMIVEMKGIIPPRPLTHNLFASILEILDVKLLRVLIYKVDNGVFYAYLYLKADETILQIDARPSDAVAFALRMEAPIFVYDDILENEGVNKETINADDDLNKPLTMEEIKAALQRAVDREDYETAAIFRDQIDRYKNKRK